MMAESLCKKSLSESQIEKLLRTNKATKHKSTKPTALSIEEKRLLASIQRLDEKLQGIMRSDHE